LVFLIRNAASRDLADVFRLARHLDSYNLPADPARLRRLIADSERSFRGKPASVAREKYLFVLEDQPRRRVVGCSLIIAKHGTPGLPHIYMSVFHEKRTSRTLNRTVEHRCLRLGFTEDGPTEVGGLVLLPDYRGRPEKLGQWLSFVRFLFIASRIERFQKTLLAEFLPVFLRKDRSPFWEYFGRRFTGLSYRTADRLSIDNKEFILSLFPRGTIYQTFFPEGVAAGLGQVGKPTAPAARLLIRLGFHYLHQIEPFDGGPFYGALTRSVGVVRRAKELQCRVQSAEEGEAHLLLAVGKTGVRAVVAPIRTKGIRADLALSVVERLGLDKGDWFWAVPFDL
jgi:arginine N-succinyltransferase